MFRFGTGSGVKTDENLIKSEDLKRKARAERFFPTSLACGSLIAVFELMEFLVNCLFYLFPGLAFQYPEL